MEAFNFFVFIHVIFVYVNDVYPTKANEGNRVGKTNRANFNAFETGTVKNHLSVGLSFAKVLHEVRPIE